MLHAVLPICPQIPVPVDVLEGRMPGFGSLIERIQPCNLIGGWGVKPAGVDVSSITAEARGPDGDANLRIVFSRAKYVRATNLFEQYKVFVVTVDREINFRWRVW